MYRLLFLLCLFIHSIVCAASVPAWELPVMEMKNPTTGKAVFMAAEYHMEMGLPEWVWSHISHYPVIVEHDPPPMMHWDKLVERFAKDVRHGEGMALLLPNAQDMLFEYFLETSIWPDSFLRSAIERENLFPGLGERIKLFGTVFILEIVLVKLRSRGFLGKLGEMIWDKKYTHKWHAVLDDPNDLANGSMSSFLPSNEYFHQLFSTPTIKAVDRKVYDHVVRPWYINLLEGYSLEVSDPSMRHRNLKWWGVLDQRLQFKENQCSMVIGCSHLVGPTGILSYFKKKGWTVATYGSDQRKTERTWDDPHLKHLIDGPPRLLRRQRVLRTSALVGVVWGILSRWR